MISADKQALRRAIRARHPGGQARDRESELICRHVELREAYLKSK